MASLIRMQIAGRASLGGGFASSRLKPRHLVRGSAEGVIIQMPEVADRQTDDLAPISYYAVLAQTASRLVNGFGLGGGQTEADLGQRLHSLRIS